LNLASARINTLNCISFCVRNLSKVKFKKKNSFVYTTTAVLYILFALKYIIKKCSSSIVAAAKTKMEELTRGEGVLLSRGFIGMCGPKGYDFSAVLVINRVSILVDLRHIGHQ